MSAVGACGISAFSTAIPLVQRFCGVQVLPTARTVSRWLQGFTMTTVERLQQINTVVVGRVLATLGIRTWTIDVDGVVVSTGLQVERAFRGFNPHHRKVPSYYPIMAHLAETRAQPTWQAVAPDVTGFVVPEATTPWGRPIWVAISRKHVQHQATKNYQLDLFDPNDGHYEYSAVTSNLGFTLSNLWRFACGRGNHEKTIAQLKSGLAFHTVPTMTYAANSAWQLLVVLTHNLLTNFQIETGAVRRAPTRKRTVLHVLQTIQSLRFTFFHRAGLLVRPNGAWRLRLHDNADTRQTYERVARALARAA